MVYYFCIRCISIQIFGCPSEDILRDCFSKGFKKECIQGQPLYQSRVLLVQRVKKSLNCGPAEGSSL